MGAASGPCAISITAPTPRDDNGKGDGLADPPAHHGAWLRHDASLMMRSGATINTIQRQHEHKSTVMTPINMATCSRMTWTMSRAVWAQV